MGATASITFKHFLINNIENNNINMDDIEFFLQKEKDIRTILNIKNYEIDKLNKKFVISFLDGLDMNKINIIRDRIIGRGCNEYYG